MPVFSEEFERGLYERIKNIPHFLVWAIALILWAWMAWVSQMAVFEAEDYCVEVAAEYLSTNGLPPEYCVNIASGFAAKVAAEGWNYIVVPVLCGFVLLGMILSIISMILMEKYDPDRFRERYYSPKKTTKKVEELE